MNGLKTLQKVYISELTFNETNELFPFFFFFFNPTVKLIGRRCIRHATTLAVCVMKHRELPVGCVRFAVHAQQISCVCSLGFQRLQQSHSCSLNCKAL